MPTSKSKAANGANGVSEALAPDPLVPDRQVAKECGDVTLMTLWRWSHDAKYQDLNFPPPIKIKTRNYRSRRALMNSSNGSFWKLLPRKIKIESASQKRSRCTWMGNQVQRHFRSQPKLLARVNSMRPHKPQ